MNSNFCERLRRSLTNLEQAIEFAQNAVQSLPTRRNDLEQRLNEYIEIVRKQRAQAELLEDSVKSGEWSEVERQAKLIRASSSMIQSDVVAALQSLTPNGGERAEFEA